MIMSKEFNAFVALEDGSVFHGVSIGAPGTVSAEICFNTSMTGYQEILTDPSYKGQVVTLTYPEIGNYGVTSEDDESYQPHASGLIIRELSPLASNWRMEKTLPDYLMDNGIPAIKEVDTRALTKKLRSVGSMKGILCTDESLTPEEAVEKAKAWEGLEGVDYVKEVTTKEVYRWDEDGEKSRHWHDAHELEKDETLGALSPADRKIVALDFGVKYNILRRLRQQGFDITVVPASTSAEEILAMDPEGVFLSNGPGDPAAVTYAHETVSKLVGKKPLFGICMGHQILGLALGGKSFKLKFGHRGGNQPVKDLTNGKVSITAQNHGFAISPESLDDGSIEVTHVNLNDGTCAGLRHKEHSAFSVQYHPEAAPGPHDANYFFSEFRKAVDLSSESK